jgi:hypothetical protein
MVCCKRHAPHVRASNTDHDPRAHTHTHLGKLEQPADERHALDDRRLAPGEGVGEHAADEQHAGDREHGQRDDRERRRPAAQQGVERRCHCVLLLLLLLAAAVAARRRRRGWQLEAGTSVFGGLRRPFGV